MWIGGPDAGRPYHSAAGTRVGNDRAHLLNDGGSFPQAILLALPVGPFIASSA